MSDFVFLGCASGGAIARLREASPAMVAGLGYRAERVVSFTDPTDTMAVMQFARSTNLYPADAQRHVGDDAAVTLLKGHLIRKCGEEADVLSARDIASTLRRVSVQAFVDSGISGDFAVCDLDAEGARFFCDPLSMVSMFYHLAEDGSCIVTTRPRLIRALLPDWAFDFRSLAWQAIAYWPLGDDTLLRNVKRIPQAGILEWRRRGLRLVERPLFFLNNPRAQSLSEALERDPDLVLDRVISRMGASLRAVLRKAPKVALAITGGRDSRAIAALATMGDASLDNVEFFTNGVPEHPDVVVGRMIAEMAGARFSNRVPGASTYSAQQILRQRLGAVFRYDGMLPIWDGGGDPGVSSQVLLQGHVGEVYRDKWFKGAHASASAFAQHMFTKGLLDPSGLLHPDVAQDFQFQLAERAAYYLDHGARTDQIGGVFRVEGMQSWESAQFAQGALWANHPVHPLYDPEMIDVSFAASEDWRDDERIHYEITKRSRVNLVDLPFAGYAWHRGLAANAGCRSVDVAPIKDGGGMVSASGWQAGLFFSSPLQRRFLDIVEACGSSPLWDYFDRYKAISAIRGAQPSISSIQMSRMYSLITSLCHAHGFEIPLKFGSGRDGPGEEARCILSAAGRPTVLHDGGRSAVIVEGEPGETYPGVPVLKVPQAVIDLVCESTNIESSETDLYRMFTQFRQAALEKRKLEADLKKALESNG